MYQSHMLFLSLIVFSTLTNTEFTLHWHEFSYFSTASCSGRDHSREDGDDLSSDEGSQVFPLFNSCIFMHALNQAITPIPL